MCIRDSNDTVSATVPTINWKDVTTLVLLSSHQRKRKRRHKTFPARKQNRRHKTFPAHANFCRVRYIVSRLTAINASPNNDTVSATVPMINWKDVTTLFLPSSHQRKQNRAGGITKQLLHWEIVGEVKKWQLGALIQKLRKWGDKMTTRVTKWQLGWQNNN